MFRLYFRVFWNKTPQYHHEPHEASVSMIVPLVFLAIASIGAGYIPFSQFVSSDGKPFATEMELIIAIPSVIVGILGIGLAAIMYKKESTLPDRISNGFSFFYKWAFHKFYFDELYLFVTKKIIFKYISKPVAWFDRHIVDGAMNGISWVTNTVSLNIKGLQSGQLQRYGFVFVTGALLLVLLFVYVLA
jgi:NADH-quinone oxidoreductase subunit L